MTKTKYVVLSGMLLSFVLGFYLGAKQFYIELDTLYKTVAHVDMSMYPNLELVEKDVDNDIAFYRFLNDWRFLEQGNEVITVYGDSCTVIATDCYGFIIEAPRQFEQGMSGTALLDKDGNQIGYISQRLSTGNVRCIWSL